MSAESNYKSQFAMGCLIAKDVFLCRRLLAATATLYLGSLVLAYFQVSMTAVNLGQAERLSLMFGSWCSLASLASLLMVPIVGGHLFAIERITGSIHFLDYVAIGRPQVFLSKLYVVSAYWALWSGSVYIAALFADLLAGDDYSAHRFSASQGGYYSISAYAFLTGMASLSASAILDSPGVSTVLGFLPLVAFNLIDHYWLGGIHSWEGGHSLLMLYCYFGGALLILISCVMYCSREAS